MLRHRCVQGLFEDYYIIYNDIYISRDDIIEINGITYEITGIDEDYNVYTKCLILNPLEFIELLGKDYIYVKNCHDEQIQKNKYIC